MAEPDEPVEVLSGPADGGLRWVVVTSGTDQDLYTMLNVVVATTAAGTEVVLAMSPLVARFGLRFAAAALPAGEWPGGLRAERDGTVLEGWP